MDVERHYLTIAENNTLEYRADCVLARCAFVLHGCLRGLFIYLFIFTCHCCMVDLRWQTKFYQKNDEDPVSGVRCKGYEW